MSLSWKKKLMLAVIEGTYGQGGNPTAGANAIMGIDMSISPMEGSDVARNIERPFMGAQATLPVGLHSKLTFKTEFAGSGAAGVAPAWGVLARAAGLAETIVADTSVTYNPVTDGHESLIFHFTIASTRYVLKGARGSSKIVIMSSGIPMIEWTFTGLFEVPTENAPASPDYTKWIAPIVASNANTPVHTLGGVAFTMKSFSLDMGQQVKPRFLMGTEEVRITDRAEVVEMQTDALPVTTFNPYQIALDASTTPLVITHGTDAGNIITVNTPSLQLQRPAAPQDDEGIVSWTLRGVPLPGTGNDQFTLVLT
ncbi:hypothetical protein [Marivivens aquimaris]|uniref:hypothetical protein n=1 Tax=Marivivens aquimaris TaxID=2774876 RepID=UPI00187E7286|nr:hypothetical protein [Marivivens aquimaris]